MSTNLCDLPPELLELAWKYTRDLDEKSAANFITCSKKLWSSDPLSAHVARLKVNLDQETTERNASELCQYDNALAAALVRKDIIQSTHRCVRSSSRIMTSRPSSPACRG